MKSTKPCGVWLGDPKTLAEPSGAVAVAAFLFHRGPAADNDDERGRDQRRKYRSRECWQN